MEEEEGTTSSSSKYGIADMSGFALNHDNRDAALVGEMRNKEFGMMNVLKSVDVEGLETMEGIIAGSPQHLLTDTTIRKYAEVLPEMKELRISLSK